MAASLSEIESLTPDKMSDTGWRVLFRENLNPETAYVL